MELFGVVVPGLPLITNVIPVGPDRYILDLPNPWNIKQFSVVLLRADIPPQTGIGIYFSVPPSQEWQYIGDLSLHKPSDIFHASWITMPEYSSASQVQLGFSFESLEAIHNRTSVAQSGTEMYNIGMIVNRIATNLSNFLSSFEGSFPQTMIPPNTVLLPKTCIDDWSRKLEDKIKRDPNYLFR